jgi:hypothetical protein
MKVIFLDMDGVMNSHQSVHFFHDFLGLKDNWFQRYMPNDMEAFNHYENEICPMAVSNMRTLLDNHPDIRFVISSTWRIGRDEEWFNKLFKHIGITGDTKCWRCDGTGEYSNGDQCKRCSGTGVKKCPINGNRLVIGRTDRLGTERGYEIQEWLDQAEKDGLEIENFLILDDDSDMCHFLGTDKFIQTDGRVGFDYIAMQKADKHFAGFSLMYDELEIDVPYLMFDKPRDCFYYKDNEGKIYTIDKGGRRYGIHYYKKHSFFAKAK